MSGVTRGAPLDRLLRPVHQWVWADTDRRLRKLLTFADVETDGGRDILRAAEVTPDPLLRRLYLEHAIDERHHGDLFRQRGAALLRARGGGRRVRFNSNPLPGGHGLDDLRIDGEPDHRLLAFLHVAEKSAAARFTIYRELVGDDPRTRAIFERILRDEVFHMNYTYMQLTRIAPRTYRRHVWHARAKRLWHRYLRIAAALAGLIGGAMLTVMYFVLLPAFAWLARRSARREPIGWTPISRASRTAPRSQY
jgi:rubrerythrin